jgi:hypothetical protein
MSLSFKLTGAKGSTTYKARPPSAKGGKAMPFLKARKESPLHKFLKRFGGATKAMPPVSKGNGGFKLIYKRSPGGKWTGKAMPKGRGGKS